MPVQGLAKSPAALLPRDDGSPQAESVPGPRRWTQWGASTGASEKLARLRRCEAVKTDPVRRVGLGSPANSARASYNPGAPWPASHTASHTTALAARYADSGTDSRGARGNLLKEAQLGVGLLPHVPNYSTAARLFRRDGTTEILTRLIEESAWPLRELENGGTVAIDSTGFSINALGAYNTEKHDPERKHHFVKAHVVCGARTKVILEAKLTDESGADYPQFIPLLERAWKRGFRPGRVAGDKAYHGGTNLNAADRLGIDPYIPFKINSLGRASGCPIWNVKYHQFHAKSDEFFRRYHARSSVECSFSAVKRLLGENLLSHTPRTRYNETLARLWAYNIWVIIRVSAELGLDPEEVLSRSRADSPVKDLVEVPREFNAVDVNETESDSSPA